MKMGLSSLLKRTKVCVSTSSLLKLISQYSHGKETVYITIDWLSGEVGLFQDRKS